MGSCGGLKVLSFCTAKCPKEEGLEFVWDFDFVQDGVLAMFGRTPQGSDAIVSHHSLEFWELDLAFLSRPTI